MSSTKIRIRDENRPVISEMFIKIIFCYKFWRFQKWFHVAAIFFIMFADDFSISSQSPESDRSVSSMAIDYNCSIKIDDTKP